MDKKNEYISILNKIKFKPILMDKIFPFTLSRPKILESIISKDNILRRKMNSIFSGVKKYSNTLGKDFCRNLKIYSNLRQINVEERITYWLNQIKQKNFTYKFLKQELNFSFIDYILKNLKTDFKYKMNIIDDSTFNNLILDYFCSLKNITLTFLPNKFRYHNYMDSKCLEYIDYIKKNSKEKYKIKQSIKIIFLIDEFKFYQEKKLLHCPNIKEIEFIFNEQNQQIYDFTNCFNSYLSKIKYLENINSITFRCVFQENYMNQNKSKELYQIFATYLLEEAYSIKSDGKSLYKLLINIKEINVENITFLYIYERMKIYYLINEEFPSLGTKKKSGNLYYGIYQNILIIHIEETQITISDLISFIKVQLNKTQDIENLMIINHNKILSNIKEEDNTILNIENLKEFIYIDDSGDVTNDNNELLKKLNLSNKHQIYKGYDEDKKLIVYRNGETHIHSLDLIDLFKYNKNLTQLELVKENININFNKVRTRLGINNLKKKIGEIEKIVNSENYFEINHFSQFIFNQKDLIELVIDSFNVCFNDIMNFNLKSLELNYSKDYEINSFNYSINKLNLSDIFPKLVNLRIGGKDYIIMNFLKLIISEKLRNISIIAYKTRAIGGKQMKRFKKLINDNKIILKLEYIESKSVEKNKENYENEEEEEEENEEEYEEYEYIDNYVSVEKNNKSKKTKKK